MRKKAAFVLGLGLSGCAVVGPLADRDMSGATAQACVDVAAPGEGGAPAAGAAPQCFVLAQQDADGRRAGWTGGPLQPGRALLAVHRAAAGCQGTFTHLTVEGSSPAPGRAELATWDLHGRAGNQREVRWDAPFQHRSYGLADIGSTLMNPAGARITVHAGSLHIQRLCFRSY